MCLVISCCAAPSWRKSLYRFHSSAGTTSCPGRGSSPGSRGSTPSTGPPCICRSEQLGRGATIVNLVSGSLLYTPGLLFTWDYIRQTRRKCAKVCIGGTRVSQ